MFRKNSETEIHAQKILEFYSESYKCPDRFTSALKFTRYLDTASALIEAQRIEKKQKDFLWFSTDF